MTEARKLDAENRYEAALAEEREASAKIEALRDLAVPLPSKGEIWRPAKRHELPMTVECVGRSLFNVVVGFRAPYDRKITWRSIAWWKGWAEHTGARP